MPLLRSPLSTVTLTDACPATLSGAIEVHLVPSTATSSCCGVSFPPFFTGAKGSTSVVHREDGKPSVVLSGVGEYSDFASKDFSAALSSAALSGATKAKEIMGADGCGMDKKIVVCFGGDWKISSDAVALMTDKLIMESHSWDMHISDRSDKRVRLRVGEYVLTTSGGSFTEGTSLTDAQAAVARAAAFADANCYARDLNETRATPGGVEFYVEEAKAVAAQSGGKLKVTVLNHKELTEMGAGCITAVGQAHPYGSALVLIDYDGAGESEERTAIVGKGVVFDSGGLQVKPTPGIEGMYLDMCGAGIVLAAMRSLPVVGSKRNVTGVLCLAENCIDALAYHPSDILKSYKGLTVEIAHTDAEGRLCLADGLAYVSEKRKPTEIIDVATLTGACIVALGHWAAGSFSKNDAIISDINKASESTGERIWRLPLFDEHIEAIKGKRADVSNLGNAGRSAGASTAAAFLSQFVDIERWAHIDIAGPSGKVGKEDIATGFGAKTLLEFCSRD